MLWEGSQKPACSPSICGDMQGSLFFKCGHGSKCMGGGGGGGDTSQFL